MILDEWQAGPGPPGGGEYERSRMGFAAGPGLTLTIGGVAILDPAWQVEVVETMRWVRFGQDIRVPNPGWKHVSTGWELTGRVRLSLASFGRLSGATVDSDGRMTWQAVGIAPRLDLALTAVAGSTTVHVAAAVGLDPSAEIRLGDVPWDLAEADREVLMGDSWVEVAISGALTEPIRVLRAT